MTKQETLLGDLRGGLCSSSLCKQLRSVAADEIERLESQAATDQEFHNIDDVVEIRKLRAALEHVLDCWTSACDPSKPQKVIDMGAIRKMLDGSPHEPKESGSSK